MECNPYRNLDALADTKSAGELLSPLDEQRLRDHQLRKLRRMWLKDQILSAREPLLPPKKENYLSAMLANERKWWKSRLHFESFTEYMYAGKHYNELPLWAVYKTQQAFRRVIGWYMLPLIPLCYYFKYGRSTPVDGLKTAPMVFPGDETFSTKLKDLEIDHSTASYKSSHKID